MIFACGTNMQKCQSAAKTKVTWKINQIHGNHKDCFTVLYVDILQHCKLQSSEVACIWLLLLPWAAVGEQLLFSAP